MGEKLFDNIGVQIHVPRQYIIKKDGSIKKVGCLSPSIFFPPRYTGHLASLIEALKVEGYWRNNGYGAICNANKSLIDHVQSLIKSLGIHVSRSLIIKIKINLEIEKCHVKIFKDDKAINFHIQNTQIKNTKVRRIVFCAPYRSAKYMLKIGENMHVLSVNVHDANVETQCELPTFVYVNLRFQRLTFTSLLKDVFKENGGKKSHTIRLNELLKESPPIVVIAAFSMLVDCEGSVDYCGLCRRIRVRMKNRRYLEDWL